VIEDESVIDPLFRREVDRTLIGSYETRMTRIEVQFDHISRDIGRLERSQVKMLEHSEQTATAMAQIAAKLADHTGAEEHQWKVVNQANKTLSEVGTALNEHLTQAGTINVRMDWIERLVFLLYGGLGTLAAIVATIYVAKLL
jgi:hypothetical protein